MAPPGKNNGVATLQERYVEVKKAAEKYNILQIGLTICHEDTETGTYTLKPYNLYLNPLIDRRLEVQRDCCFQSSAVQFLLENKFSMKSLYTDGVSYLSRDEETRALARINEKPSTRKVLDVKETEHESLAFLGLIRRLIDDWLALGEDRNCYLNIPPPKSPIASPEAKALPSVLNSYQKRLIHQLIEVEYPSLVTVSRASFIQIIYYNEQRENAARVMEIKRLQERTRKQRGFMWIIEALTGGDLTDLDPYCFTTILSDSMTIGPQPSLREFSEKMKQRLQSHRPVLVGHNIFIDLVYLCRCFIGALPDKVEDFQTMVKGLFPMVMDTKFLATHDCGSITPKSSLSDINDSLLDIETPKTCIHDEHSKYGAENFAHEAGYDSLLTAQVFVKLSAQLRDSCESKFTSQPPEHKIQQATTSPEAFKTRLARQSPKQISQRTITPRSKLTNHAPEKISQRAAAYAEAFGLKIAGQAPKQINQQTITPRSELTNHAPEKISQRAAAYAEAFGLKITGQAPKQKSQQATTLFEATISSKKGRNGSVEWGSRVKKRTPTVKTGNWRNGNWRGTRFDVLEVEETTDSTKNVTIEPHKLSDSDMIAQKAANGELIPRPGAQFWKIYGNKLRVFGTQERVCNIA
ncbi:ribonuclease H-like domain-containing protein [Aspergillus avenaceus]|uniref:Ribonuclease H-like domain-containing protein n=1 Tax=Aspergillus avenaceus TaxID=36643 RepID=A0A5N6U823_ASPAV|nr:ribonuclease H-like domain-containing protein [Aspergillus avenaceus]